MIKTALTTIKALLAGVLAMLVFYQGLLAGLHYLGETPVTAWDMSAGWFWHWPVLALWAAWGAAWGVVLWGLVRGTESAGYYVGAILLAAIVPSAAFLLLVMPLSGRAMANGWDGHLIIGVVLLHAFWGLGTALFMRLFKPRV